MIRDMGNSFVVLVETNILMIGCIVLLVVARGLLNGNMVLRLIALIFKGMVDAGLIRARLRAVDGAKDGMIMVGNWRDIMSVIIGMVQSMVSLVITVVHDITEVILLVVHLRWRMVVDHTNGRQVFLLMVESSGESLMMTQGRVIGWLCSM